VNNHLVDGRLFQTVIKKEGGHPGRVRGGLDHAICSRLALQARVGDLVKFTQAGSELFA